jgi:hypothetical protein
VLDDQAALESEDIEEDTLTEYESLLLSENIGSVLKSSHHRQMMIFRRELTDILSQAFDAVGRVGIVLCVFLRIHVLGRKVEIPACDASKYRQYFFNVACRHC